MTQAPAKKSPKRKRIFLVNRDFQLRYTMAAIIVGILSTALSVFLILYPLYAFEILRIPRFLPIPVLIMMAGAAVINIGVVAIMGIYMTHKVAGPMFSLVRHFRYIEQGQFAGEMRLREGDDLRYVVRNFNEMLGSLRRMTEQDLTLITKKGADGLPELTARLGERIKKSETESKPKEPS